MTDRYKRLATPASAVVMVGWSGHRTRVARRRRTRPRRATKVIAFFHAHHTAMYVAAFSLAYAAVAGVLFFVSLAAFLRERGSQLLGCDDCSGRRVVRGRTAARRRDDRGGQ